VTLLTASAVALALGTLAWAVPDPFLRWACVGSVPLLWRYVRSGRTIWMGMALCLPLSMICAGIANSAIAGASPVTVDAALARIDGGVAAACWRWTLAHGWAHEVLAVVYNGLPAVVGVSIAFTEEES